MAVSEEQLQQDLQAAMRGRESLKLGVLRGIISAAKNLKVEKQVKEVAEADLVALIRKEVNKRLESISYAEKGGRTDLVDQNRAEIALLEVYLPTQMDAATLEAAIQKISTDLGTKEIKLLMAELKARHAGTYDGKLASELIRKLSA